MSFSQWVVNLSVYGPITLQGIIRLNEEKGLRHPDTFMSRIALRNSPTGVQIELTARASTDASARKSSITFIGRMLDVLTLSINKPLYLSYHQDRPLHHAGHSVKRIIEDYEWDQAFKKSTMLIRYKPDFLRGLGWYRKGLNSEDPLDSFLGFWNSIEIVASMYCNKNEKTKLGVKNQIWDCFNTLWGDCSRWPVVPGDKDWVDTNYDYRVRIAHGAAEITSHFVEEVVEKISPLQQLSHRFLEEWGSKRIDPELMLFI